MALDPQNVQQGMDIFNTAYLHSQIFWTGLSFFIMLGILWWKVLPAILKMLDDRALTISTDMSRAEQARKDAEQALVNYETKLAKAKEEATAILSTARTDAKKMTDARIAEAEIEITKKKEDAKAAIAQAQANAMKDVEKTVASLAISIGEALIETTLDKKQAEKLTDKALKQLN